MIRQFLLFLTLCVVLSVTGCGGCRGAGTSYFAYREAGFSAEIGGTLDGSAFCATVVHDPSGASYIRYSAPASLDGLCVELSRDGVARATLNGLSYVADADTLAGLLRPLTALSSCSTEVRAVQKRDGRTTLSLADGVTLTLAPDGTPARVESPHVCFDVVWWETTQ